MDISYLGKETGIIFISIATLPIFYVGSECFNQFLKAEHIFSETFFFILLEAIDVSDESLTEQQDKDPICVDLKND